MSMWKVTYSIDSLDTNPTVTTYTDFSDAQDYICNEVNERVQHQVDHSPYALSQSDLDALQEQELTLVTLEQVQS